jgi:hypothetical protein
VPVPLRNAPPITVEKTVLFVMGVMQSLPENPPAAWERIWERNQYPTALSVLSRSRNAC